MKNSFLAVLFLLVTVGLHAQKNQTAAKGPDKAACGQQTVIDITGLQGSVESQIWDPRPVDAKKNTSKVSYEVVNQQGQEVHGWKQCDLKRCGTVTWQDQEGKKKVQTRTYADKARAAALAQHTSVLDLTSFGPGTYTVRAKSGESVCETTVIIPNNGLSIPKPHDKHMEHKSGK